MMPLIIVVALLGLAIGPFLNVVIYRIPAANHCPGHPHTARPAGTGSGTGTTSRYWAGWYCTAGAPTAPPASAPGIRWSNC